MYRFTQLSSLSDTRDDLIFEIIILQINLVIPKQSGPAQQPGFSTIAKSFILKYL